MSSSQLLTLSSENVSVRVDPARGADLLGLQHEPCGSALLMSVSADGSLRKAPVASTPASIEESHASWMSSYRGGCQLLFPHAGPAETDERGWNPFHGEASRRAWRLDEVSDTHAMLQLELGDRALVVRRKVSVRGAVVTARDEVVAVGDAPSYFRLGYHPAFGGDLLEGVLDISVSAERFSVLAVDPRHSLGAERRSHSPHGRGQSEFCVRSDLLARRRFVSACADQISTGRASIVNRDNGLGVVVEWDRRLLPYMWVWIETGATQGWPWFGQGRAMGLEPCTHPLQARTGDAVEIQPGERRVYELSLTVSHDPAQQSGDDRCA